MAGEAVNQYERACRAWPILTAAAQGKSTITYGELSHRLGLTHHRPVRFILGKIQSYCLDAKLPPLTIVVVSQTDHHPGTGFIAWDIDDWQEGLRRVQEYPWGDRPNPFAFADDGTTPDALAKKLVAQPDSSASVYGTIQDRGYAQIVFRLALLLAYGRRCAFCGLSLVPALQAAHIIPWSKATPAQRVDPRNGLLLCSTHHSLFDAKVLSVGADCAIRVSADYATQHQWIGEDHRVARALDGSQLRPPADTRLRPSNESLRYREKAPQPD